MAKIQKPKDWDALTADELRPMADAYVGICEVLESAGAMTVASATSSVHDLIATVRTLSSLVAKYSRDIQVLSDFDGWYPMDSFPKDGTIVDVFDAVYKYQVPDVYWTTQYTPAGEMLSKASKWSGEASHWRHKTPNPKKIESMKHIV